MTGFFVRALIACFWVSIWWWRVQIHITLSCSSGRP